MLWKDQRGHQISISCVLTLFKGPNLMVSFLWVFLSLRLFTVTALAEEEEAFLSKDLNEACIIALQLSHFKITHDHDSI